MSQPHHEDLPLLLPVRHRAARSASSPSGLSPDRVSIRTRASRRRAERPLRRALGSGAQVSGAAPEAARGRGAVADAQGEAGPRRRERAGCIEEVQGWYPARESPRLRGTLERRGPRALPQELSDSANCPVGCETGRAFVRPTGASGGPDDSETHLDPGATSPTTRRPPDRGPMPDHACRPESSDSRRPRRERRSTPMWSVRGRDGRPRATSPNRTRT